MKLASSSLQIDRVRLDGGTQVREGLDDAWVAELAELYREGHEIDPVLVVVETRGEEAIYWLADGFHRVAAKRRIGSNSIMATVRAGSAATLDMAKLLASAANKNGRPLAPGEKRRAVLMARSTPEGKAMGVRELARHCGVTVSYVSEILGEARCSVPNTNANHIANPTPRRVLRDRIDAALRVDPKRADTVIAKEIGCLRHAVARRRKALGIGGSDPTAWVPAPSRDRAAEMLAGHPEWADRRIARETGAAPKTVALLRERTGAPRPPRAKRSAEPKESAPSAPTRKGSDPRDGADVIQLRRPEAPKPDPRAGYSSMQVRDMADAVIRSFTAPDFALLVARFGERRGREASS